MTKDEALKKMQAVKSYMTSGNPIWSVTEMGEAFDMAIEALERTEPQWIPCSERLPEIGVNVLTVWTYEEFEPDIVVAYLKEWKGELYFDDIFGEHDHALEDVPAWMPLPEPWRGEGHETN